MKARTAGLVALIAGALVISTATISSATVSSASSEATRSTGSVEQTAGTAAKRVKVNLTTSSPQLAACFPRARAKVTVDLTTATLGKDTFTISAGGLKPKTDFTVFLLEQSGAPFGAAEYIGDFTTDRRGEATNTFKLIVEEAFAFNGGTGARTDLGAIGFWFADPKDDDGCLGAGSPVTPFDGDGQAGVQMMNSGTALLP